MLKIKEVDVGKDQDFSVSTRAAGGQGKLDVKMASPSRRPIPCKLESDSANELHCVKYIPSEEGTFRVDISYDGNPVPGSPFTVEAVMPPDPSKVLPESSSPHRLVRIKGPPVMWYHLQCSWLANKVLLVRVTLLIRFPLCVSPAPIRCEPTVQVFRGVL